MLLSEVVLQIDALREEDCVGMRKPWGLSAECRIEPLVSDARWPQSARAAGFEYFLEVAVAREVLAAFSRGTLSVSEKAQILLYYAENDAFPEWANAKANG